jgi:uncharacterized protein involved in exopolysaccharide biosynthesis
MPDLFYLISKWWKQVLGMVLLSTAIATVIVFLLPNKYLATTTALAASPYANDKSSVFNNNIQALYPSVGTSDELDIILSTAQLDTLFISVSEQLDLGNQYKMKEKGIASLTKAASLLKKDTRIQKGDYGELKIRVWHEDNHLVPQIANALAEKLQKIHQDIQNQSNISTLNSIASAKSRIQNRLDSFDASGKPATIALKDQLLQYENLYNEYSLMVERNPPALIIVERARLAEWPDKPNRVVIIVATLVLSFLFSFLVIVILERRNMKTN